MTGPDPGAVDFKRFVASIAATAAATLSHVEALLQPEVPGADTSPAGPEAPAAESREPEAAAPSPEQRAEGIRNGLAGAHQLIDTLAMLEQKTKGNLTHDEQQFLQTTLTQLRFSYVRLADRVRGAEKGGESTGSG